MRRCIFLSPRVILLSWIMHSLMGSSKTNRNRISLVFIGDIHQNWHDVRRASCSPPCQRLPRQPYCSATSSASNRLMPPRPHCSVEASRCIGSTAIMITMPAPRCGPI